MDKNCTHLKVWLMNKGITQTKIAEDTGLHQNTVSKLVRTGDGNKSVKVLMQLYLKIPKGEFEELLQQVLNGKEERRRQKEKINEQEEE